MTKKQKQFLNQFFSLIDEKQKEKIKSITVEHFCNNPKDAEALARLVVSGKKTATCSLKYWYDNYSDITVPNIGNIMLVTDFNGNPICITQTTSVEVKRFCEVDEAFALLEGEGDGTLKFWRKTHWQFFSEECLQEGIKPSEDMLLYLEQFKVVYKID
jgi:uncharacterized protein YhfF